MKDLFVKPIVKVNVSGQTKAEVIQELSQLLFERGRIRNVEQYMEDVFFREKEYSTYMGDGVGIPHALSTSAVEPSIAIGVSHNGFLYGSEKCYIVALIAIPLECTYQHIQLLGDINSVFLNSENIQKIRNAKTETDVLQLFTEKEPEEDRPYFGCSKKFFIACTGCVSGVAHTYLAQKALTEAALKYNVEIKVETNGAIGIDNVPTKEEIERADCIIIASDKAVDMKRFEGKRIIFSSVKEGVINAEQLIKKAMEEKGEIYHSQTSHKPSNMTKKAYVALMNGIAHMIPLVAVGGILTSFAYAFGGTQSGQQLVVAEDTIWYLFYIAGDVGLKLMLPVLSAYIAYAIGDEAALAPGFIGGYLANNGQYYNSEYGAGFFGAVLIGFLAGYIVFFIRKIKIPETVLPLMPMVIIPVCVSLIVTFFFVSFIGQPLARISNSLYMLLNSLNGGSLIVLGIIIGLMQGFDMGGPFGKTVLMFSVACIAEGNFSIMGAQAVAIPVAPIGMWIATQLDKKDIIFNKGDKSNGFTSLVMGFFGLSEGALPFVGADPVAVIPACMIGSAIASTMGLLFGIQVRIAWGGPLDIILGLTNHPLLATICILAGAVSTGILTYIFKYGRMKHKI